MEKPIITIQEHQKRVIVIIPEEWKVETIKVIEIDLAIVKKDYLEKNCDKIQVVNQVRLITKAGLREAKSIVENW